MADVKVPVIFVIGGPGSGKGTQCERIVQKYGFTHLSTGDLLRAECKSGSERGERLVDIMKKGELVSNDEVLALLKEAIEKNVSNSHGFLVDGYPREVGQAKEFESQVCSCSFLLFFDVPDDVMMERLLERGKTSGREDDNKETIAKRLDTFHTFTQPILDHYGDKVQKVTATGTVDEIFAQVTKIVDTYFNPDSGGKSGTSAGPVVPEELPELLRGLSYAVLRDKPRDIISYAAEHFQQLCEAREQEKENTSGKAEDVNETEKDESESEEDDEEDVKVPVIFVIGGPGAGKGTQCERIVQKYGFTHLSTGDLLRAECKSGSERGEKLVDIMKKGELVPNDEVLALLKEAIQDASESHGFLIDGYPREVGQAKEFESQVCSCSFLLFFDVPDDVMMERLLERGKTSGREDDNKETIAKRLDTFHTFTQPILDHYGDKVKKVKATGTVDEIFAEVTKIVDSSKVETVNETEEDESEIEDDHEEDVKVPVIFVIGGPGAGKGTQCERIVQKYGFTHLSTGDLLRAECKSGSERGEKLVDIMKRGELVPNDEVLALLKEAIEDASESHGFLIDGYPREVGQAKEFESQVCSCSFLLFFDVPDDVMMERLLERGKTSGREDDNKETISKRLDTFHTFTQPILDHYGDKVQKVKATGTVDEIFAEVTKIVDSSKAEDVNETEEDESEIEEDNEEDLLVPVIFVIGGPGAGKGTQCERIVQKYGFTHLSTGDLLRAECKSGSERGEKLVDIMKRGELVPNDEVLALLKEAIEDVSESHGFLVDGYPREVGQAKEFESQVCSCSFLLFFDVPDDVMMERLIERGKTSGREDDNKETIAKRLDTFHSFTQPILDHYGDKVKKVKATGTVDEIFAEVTKIFDSSKVEAVNETEKDESKEDEDKEEDEELKKEAKNDEKDKEEDEELKKEAKNDEKDKEEDEELKKEAKNDEKDKEEDEELKKEDKNDEEAR